MKKADELFLLYHLDMGLSEEEIDDLMDESTYNEREHWLAKMGFDLND